MGEGCVIEAGEPDLMPVSREAPHRLEDHAGRGLVERVDVDEVEHDGLRRRRLVADEPHHALRAGEPDVALQVVDVGVDAARTAPQGNDVGVPDDGAGGRRHVHEVHVHVLTEPLEDLHPAGGMAVLVERRRERREPHLPGQRADDAAPDAALGGDADGRQPVAGRVVHAAAQHDRQHLAGRARADDLLTGHRVEAAVGERRRHDGEVTRRHAHGALLDVAVDDDVRVVRQHVVTAQHVSDGEIAVRVVPFRFGDGPVDAQLAPGEGRQTGDDASHARRLVVIGGGDERVRRDGAGVDHGVERALAARLEADLVERLTARFDADATLHLVEAAILDRHRVDERFADRLNGELRLGVTGAVDHAVDGGDCEGEQ